MVVVAVLGEVVVVEEVVMEVVGVVTSGVAVLKKVELRVIVVHQR